ncbi:hypothetical protein HELRODRAFT_173357 [Helobdella robusta]|uniref:Uncharacterized protein n=1 Tax=Helobdella robusta TaxID=6412 RepID=T1F6Q3_HELRO|nr:hypothetical protein HELRODRAFT_173357 [Helobdella robusta]ESO03660.1 hypothetical protein HELRODRAFT_173357 [Helobdella robusta]
MARLLSSPCTSLLLLIIASVSVIDVAGGKNYCRMPPVDDFCENLSKMGYRKMDLKDYPGCGVEVPQSQTASAPTVIYGQAVDSFMYMVVMVDPDAPDPKNPTDRYWLHWVKKNITGVDLQKGITSDGKNDLMEFIPPSPVGPEPHRYQIYIFLEPRDENYQLIDKERPRWNVSKFGIDSLICDYFYTGYEFLTRNPNPDVPTKKPDVPTKKPDAPSTKPPGPVSTETQPHTTSTDKEPSGVATCSASLLIIFSLLSTC